MMMFRGDAHRLYVQLKKAKNQKLDLHKLPELREIAEIQEFYQTLDNDTLQRIFYRMVKERSGSGIIPIFVSTFPWLLFMFSNRIQDFLFSGGILVLATFSLLYLIIIVFYVVLHFRERAWADVHIHIIKDILEK
jgi:hypothetical protein